MIKSRVRTPQADRGGATVLVLALGLVFVLAGGFGAAVGAARLARQQAVVAADLGALAGAGRVLRDPVQPCGRAGAVASANGARLVACRLDGLDIVLTVEVTVAPLPGLGRAARASARAGPIRDVPTAGVDLPEPIAATTGVPGPPGQGEDRTERGER